jgi:hypothetical protein
MKARPIENVLKHCERVDDEYGDPIPPNQQSGWNRNQGWIDALKYVMDNYECTPKENK